MSQRVLIAGVAATAVIALVGLGGCGLRETTVTDTAAVTGPVTSVVLDTDDGGVTLRGTPGATQVTVARAVTYNGNAAPTGTSFRVDGGVLTLGGCGPHCSVDYTVDAPAGLPVNGKTSNGEVDLSAVGPVRIGTDNGGVDLDGVTGPVDVETDSGGVTGRRLDGGTITVQTENGRIELAPASPQNVQARTSNGEITLTVPPGAYQVNTTTDNGHQDIGIPNDPAGQHRINLQTDNGAITVQAA